MQKLCPAPERDPHLPLLFGLLQMLPPDERAQLLESGTEYAVPARTTIWHENEPLSGALLLSQGILAARSQATGNTRAHLYGFMRPGGMAGLHGLFNAAQTRASLISQEPSHFLLLPFDALHATLAAHPQLWQEIARNLSEGVIHLLDTISLLSQGNGYQRLRQRLLVLERRARNERGTLGLAISQQDLAAQIGLSREMVNRMLAELRQGGYVDQDELGRLRVIKPLPKQF